jgi:hypothetical protein
VLQKVAAAPSQKRISQAHLREYGERSRIARERWDEFIDVVIHSPRIPDNFEHRVWLACQVDRALPDPDRRFLGWRPTWWLMMACATDRDLKPALLDERDDRVVRLKCKMNGTEGIPARAPKPKPKFEMWRETVTQYDEYDKKPKFIPSHKQVSDWLVVMSWCARLEKADFRIIQLRSCGFFYSEIADRMNSEHRMEKKWDADKKKWFVGRMKKWDTKLSRETARLRYERAMQELQAISQGKDSRNGRN